MKNQSLKETGKPREPSGKRRAGPSRRRLGVSDAEKDGLAEAKTRVPGDAPLDTLDYLEVFRTIEALTRSLKTFNVLDSCGLREKEKKKILEMIFANFTAPDDAPVVNSTMIIFGQPGLGKTLLVQEVFGHLQRDQLRFVCRELGQTDSTLAPRELVCLYLNAMNFANCFEFIDEFLGLVEEKVPLLKKSEKRKGNPVVRLEVFLSKLALTLESHRFVVLIDELESLSQNDKTNFHHLMQILNLRRSGFVTVCISNTLNLFSNLNGNSLFLNFEYLVFKPYAESDLLSILVARMRQEETPVPFEVLLPLPALSFVVKKALKSSSSDVRFVLTMTQTIIEHKQTRIAELQRQKHLLAARDVAVSMPEILQVFNDKLTGDWAGIIRKLSFQTQILLLGLWQTIDAASQTVKLVT